MIQKCKEIFLAASFWIIWNCYLLHVCSCSLFSFRSRYTFTTLYVICYIFWHSMFAGTATQNATRLLFYIIWHIKYSRYRNWTLTLNSTLMFGIHAVAIRFAAANSFKAIALAIIICVVKHKYVLKCVPTKFHIVLVVVKVFIILFKCTQ